MVEVVAICVEFLSPAPPSPANIMKKNKVISIVLALLFTLSGCEANRADDIPSFFKEYNIDSYLSRMDKEDIYYIDSKDNYALMFYAGDGPELILYQYTTNGSEIEVVAYTQGQYTISGGLSINHVQLDNKHIYFGTFADTHWHPSDDTVISTDRKTLYTADSSGNMSHTDISGAAGYLCIMDTPISDMQILNTSNQTILDLNTYLADGYTITECQLTSAIITQK